MTKVDIDFLERIWFQLAEDEFSNDKLVELVLKDGGLDMSNLSRADVASLIEGTFSGDWHKPAFSFSELLTYYQACGDELTSHQIVGWVFASFVISDAIKKGASEWELQLNFFINGFILIKERLQIDDSIHILRRVFSETPSENSC